jgi:hypothetical protein
MRTPDIDAAIHALRSLGSQLHAQSHGVPFYRVFSVMRVVPTLDELERARMNLIGLSNSIYRGNIEHNERHRKDIIQALNLKVPE